MFAPGPVALWWALAFAALATGARYVSPDARAAARLARWSLFAASLFALVSAVALFRVLAEPDLGIGFVARNITLNLSLPWRAAALWADPEVAALTAAGPVLLFAAWDLRRSGSLPALSAAGAVGVLMLLGCAITSPFQATGFLPSEGLGLSADLRHPVAVAARAVACLSVVPATIAVGRAVRNAQLGATVSVALVLTVATAWLAYEGAIRSGEARPLSIAAVWGGRVLVAVVAASTAFVVDRVASQGAATARLSATLAVVSGSLAAMHSRPADRLGDVLAVASLVLTAAALWSARVAMPSPSGRPWLRWLPLATALSVAGCGACNMLAARAESVILASGGEATTVHRLTVTHQGVSRFESEEGNAHVVSVAVGLGRSGRTTALAVAEQREYVDRRDRAIGPPATRPSVRWRGVARVNVWLDEARARDVVALTVRHEPLAAVWPTVSLLLLVAAALWKVTPIARLVACDRCGTRPEPAARWCSRCGRAVA